MEETMREINKTPEFVNRIYQLCGFRPSNYELITGFTHVSYNSTTDYTFFGSDSVAKCGVSRQDIFKGLFYEGRECDLNYFSIYDALSVIIPSNVQSFVKSGAEYSALLRHLPTEKYVVVCSERYNKYFAGVNI